MRSFCATASCDLKILLTTTIKNSTIANLVIRAHLGIDHSITFLNKPLPYSRESRIKLLQLGGTMGFQLAVNVGFATAFVASFYVLSSIKERQVKSKFLQFVIPFLVKVKN